MARLWQSVLFVGALVEHVLAHTSIWIALLLGTHSFTLWCGFLSFSDFVLRFCPCLDVVWAFEYGGEQVAV